MAIDFPASPTTNQTFTAAGVTWKWDGVKWVAQTPGGGTTRVGVQVFTASGTYVPSANLISAIIECVGGGGGGGGVAGAGAYTYSGAGGGSGSYSRAVKTAAQIGASQTVTIGAGGSAGTSAPGNGGNGGDTSVGALVIGKGGTGGGLYNGAGNAVVGGAGGIAGTGDFTPVGNAGGVGGFNTAAAFTDPFGGGSFF